MSNATIFLECKCGANRSDPLDEFAEDDITQTVGNQLVVFCPDCEEYRKTEDWARIWHGGDTPWFKLELGHTARKPSSGENPFAPLLPANAQGDDSPDSDEDSSVAELPRLSQSPPDCSWCGEELTEDDRREGPEAPEVGWEYYECPDCGRETRPDAR